MKEQLDFSWEGALADLKDQYTSVELQHEAMQWRIDELDADARKGGTELFMQDKQAKISLEHKLKM
ncbi:MAG: hypothetical protein CDV28_12219 [Candidatus Electronema aureum]|uniref:Uncharacterized protein n=1 Tax=Candidatus Electronema aureum TaxID=2005002 RepID=A0A521G0R0_9BACT|nr:MAG: hypothetical protein CDV28_12219 [Candidatus Electronema aureum]